MSPGMRDAQPAFQSEASAVLLVAHDAYRSSTCAGVFEVAGAHGDSNLGAVELHFDRIDISTMCCLFDACKNALLQLDRTYQAIAHYDARNRMETGGRLVRRIMVDEN